jgi:hypothetical protein
MRRCWKLERGKSLYFFLLSNASSEPRRVYTRDVTFVIISGKNNNFENRVLFLSVIYHVSKGKKEDCCKRRAAATMCSYKVHVSCTTLKWITCLLPLSVFRSREQNETSIKNYFLPTCMFFQLSHRENTNLWSMIENQRGMEIAYIRVH